MSKPSSGPEFEPKTPSQEIADMLGANYGEDFGFDEKTLSELAGLSFNEAFEVAYGYLTQAGIDADDALASWMENPES